MSTSVGSVTKFFPSAQNGFTTTLASTISSGAATVPLNSVAGYNNGETAVMVVDPTDASKKQTFTGVVDTSGIQLTGVIWTAGTNQTHTGGSTVVDYATATHISMMTKGLLRDHNQSGYHKTLNDDNGNEWLKQTSTVSAVNEVTLANAATGTPPVISATGGDTNVNLRISGKGTGKAHVDGFSEIAFDFIISGLGWTADSAGVNRNASMAAGFVYINGQRSDLIPLVTARTFTASKDTYIDILNTAGTFSIVYTEVTNNAASPALAANSIRIGIIVTAAGSIAAAASINQGQEDRVLPIASSIPYSVTDSLGNLICPRDPNRKTLGYRQLIANQTGISTTTLQITSLSCPVIVPTGRKVKISVHIASARPVTAFDVFVLSIWDGVVVSGTEVGLSSTQPNSGGTTDVSPYAQAVTTPATASKTYNAGGQSGGTGGNTTSILASATQPSFILVELA